MYSVGIFSNISELKTFPFANIKEFAEHNFLQKENYEFSLYTKDQKEIFLAKVQTGGFDGIVFATNTANDATLKEFFVENKDAFNGFLEAGKGILILLQYHLAIDNSFFDILTEKDFPGLEREKIQTKQNNNENNGPVEYDKTLIDFHEDELIFHYPREVLENEKKEYNILGAMEKNNWQEKKSSPLFAYINSYPNVDFRSVIDYKNDKIGGQKSFCIISRNANKRVAITTLALDLEENFFLENLISYIARGEPSVFFKPCGKCGENGGRCDFVDLMYNTKIHFSDNELIKPMVKYEILTCGKSPISTTASEVPNDEKVIPIKQLMPIANSNGQICRCVKTSSVRYMCKLGAQYLRTQLRNGKYGSLMGTLTTLRFFKMIGLEVPKCDKIAILNYLEKHNKDKSTFDHITRPTNVAAEILEKLDYEGLRKESKYDKEIRFNQIKDDTASEPLQIDTDYLATLPISKVAEILGDENFIFNSLSTDDERIKESLLIIFAKIVSSRDVDKISWENDCYMTALMLIVLLKIENWLVSFDKKYETNCVAKINTIASYFEESSEKSLYNALVKSADNERKKAYKYSRELQDKIQKILMLEAKKEELEKTKNDFESVEKRVAQHQTINIILAFSIAAIFIFCLTVVLKTHYSNENLYDFLIGFQPLQILFSLAGIIVVPFTIGSIYYWRPRIKKKKRDEQETQSTKSEDGKKNKNKKSDEPKKSWLSRIKESLKNKKKKDDESQTS